MGVPSALPRCEDLAVAECETACRYRVRRPEATPLYRLVEAHYDEVKGAWEERFEERYGRWRGFVDGVVLRYLDCGVFSAGLARVRCGTCHAEYIIACSCRGRGFCPSCGAKRAVAFGALLRDEVLEPVGHAMWTFTVPKMLRRYFLRDRKLLGELCRAAWETVAELMAAAAGEVDGFRTGMVAAVQTAGDLLNLHPHVHAIVPRGGWDRDGTWVPVPFVDAGAAERLFRHKVLKFLMAKGLVTEERAALLLSWDHHTGFSVDASVRAEPEDGAGLERMARYILRGPLSLERMRWDGGDGEVLYTPKGKGGEEGAEEQVDALDFLARVIAHVPDPRLHLLRYFGHYSNVSRGKRRKGSSVVLAASGASSGSEAGEPTLAERQAARRAWARLIKRVYEVDPLVCAKCGGAMKVIAVILDPKVIRKILEHIERRDEGGSRGPPGEAGSLPAAS